MKATNGLTVPWVPSTNHFIMKADGAKIVMILIYTFKSQATAIGLNLGFFYTI